MTRTEDDGCRTKKISLLPYHDLLAGREEGQAEVKDSGQRTKPSNLDWIISHPGYERW